MVKNIYFLYDKLNQKNISSLEILYTFNHVLICIIFTRLIIKAINRFFHLVSQALKNMPIVGPTPTPLFPPIITYYLNFSWFTLPFLPIFFSSTTNSQSLWTDKLNYEYKIQSSLMLKLHIQICTHVQKIDNTIKPKFSNHFAFKTENL